MKKQILIFATVCITFAFSSCSKEKIKQNEPGNIEEIATKKGGGGSTSSLTKALEGWYRFDGNLVEAYGKLKDAVPTTAGADIYTGDRKGNLNSAIKFNGRYGVLINDIPIEKDFSVSVWAKFDAALTPAGTTNYFLNSANNDICPELAQETASFTGVVSTPTTTGVPSAPLNNDWHHLVATYDGFELRFFVDGNYVGNVMNGAGFVYPAGSTMNYQLGYTTLLGTKDIFSTWFGCVDDLRLYTRVLTAAEVLALYNL